MSFWPGKEVMYNYAPYFLHAMDRKDTSKLLVKPKDVVCTSLSSFSCQVVPSKKRIRSPGQLFQAC